MALISKLTPIDSSKTGNLKLTILNLDLVSIGTTLYSPTEHPGWLLCNGALVPNSGVYTSLYAYLGTKYGSAGQLPDYTNGKTPIPKGPTYFTSEGAAGGETTHLLTIAEIPSHSHSVYIWWNNGQPTYNPYEEQAASVCYQQYSYHGNNVTRPGGGYDGSYPHTNPYDGYGTAHENMHPYQVVGSMLIRY